ncbi:MAG TPA: LamG domain-containing protein, partial [Phenylobacterium sp.]|nr:LamG domain-containing protein [Phenylobacterium sp.]
GLSTIMTDELHSYEEGINSNSEALYINWGDPKLVERLMTTVRAYDRIIKPNPAGHLHFITSWYSGAKVYSEGPWEWSKYYSYLVLHPGLLIGAYNGDPTARKFVIGLADGLLAHGRKAADGSWTWPVEINWRTDATKGVLPIDSPPMQLLWGAWRFTGDQKYLQPLLTFEEKLGVRALSQMNENAFDVLGKRDAWTADAVNRGEGEKASAFDRWLAWQADGDKRHLEELYGEEIRSGAQRFYTQTEGHWWSDRVELPSETLQRSRLGGVALKRNWIWPGHTVSWRFEHDAEAEQVAILVSGATPSKFKVEAFNTTDHAVRAGMTGWNVTAGEWRMSSGAGVRTFPFEKSAGVELTFAPGQNTWTFELAKVGPPVEGRPDLGIGPEDVVRKGRSLAVTVHSLGAADTPPGSLVVEDAAGKAVTQATIPPLKAPRDLMPKTATLRLALPAELKGGRMRLSLPTAEITRLNNSQPLPSSF